MWRKGPVKNPIETQQEYLLNLIEEEKRARVYFCSSESSRELTLNWGDKSLAAAVAHHSGDRQTTR